MAKETEYDTLVGTIVGAHGVQGALKVRVATPQALAMIAPAPRPSESAPRPTISVWVGKSAQEGGVREIVSAKKPAVKGPVLIKLVGVTTRTAAEAEYGLNIYVPAELRAPLSDGEYFVEDLIGIDVVTDCGNAMGRVTQVIQNPANDVYETDLGALIPAVKAFVLEIDIAGKRMTVKDDPGLLPDPKADQPSATQA